MDSLWGGRWTLRGEVGGHIERGGRWTSERGGRWTLRGEVGGH